MTQLSSVGLLGSLAGLCGRSGLDLFHSEPQHDEVDEVGGDAHQAEVAQSQKAGQQVETEAAAETDEGQQQVVAEWDEGCERVDDDGDIEHGTCGGARGLFTRPAISISSHHEEITQTLVTPKNGIGDAGGCELTKQGVREPEQQVAILAGEDRRARDVPTVEVAKGLVIGVYAARMEKEREGWLSEGVFPIPKQGGNVLRRFCSSTYRA